MGAEVKLGWDNSDLFRGEQAARSRLARFDKAVVSIGDRAGAALGSIAGTLGLVGAGFGAGRVAVEAFDRAVSFESLRAGFEAVVGDGEEAEKQLERLSDLASQPGVGYRMAIELSRDLQAAGFEAEQAERMIAQVGNAVAVMGGGQDDVSQVVDAMKDLVAEGALVDDKVDRIAERLPQVRKLMEEAFGSASTTKVREMGVSAEEFLRVIVDRLENDIPRASDTTKTKLENLADTWDRFLVSVGEELNGSGVLGASIDRLAKILEGAQLVDMDKALEGGEADPVVEAYRKYIDARRRANEEFEKGMQDAAAGKSVDPDTLPSEIARKEREAQSKAMNFLAPGYGEVDPSRKDSGPMLGVEKMIEYMGATAQAAMEAERLVEAEKESEARREALREKADLTERMTKALKDEIEVLRLKAAGREEEAKALQLENELREDAQRLAKETNMTEAEALRLLKQKSDLQQRIDGGDSGRRRIGPRDPSQGRLTRKSFEGLDAWDELQKRKGNAGVADFSGLDNREFRLLDGAKERAMAATEVKPAARSGAKDPAEVLGKLAEEGAKQSRFLEEIARG